MRAHQSFGLLCSHASVLLLAVFFFGCSVLAKDWPQYRGSTHDGVSTDRIKKVWTGSITNPVWKVTLGNGLSSFSVSGGRVFTQVKRNTNSAQREVCLALSAANGAELWATPLDSAIYDGSVGADDGPRSTPTYGDGAVYVLTSYLKLCRLNATNGSVIWVRDLRTLYGGTVIGWQNAASPVLDGGLLFVNANCSPTRLMAFHIEDGSPAWKREDEAMTHATPIVATIAGVRQVVFATQSGLVSLEALTGQFLWKFPYPFAYSTSLGASPVVWQDVVFVSGSSGYSMGSCAARVVLSNGVWSATQLWYNPDLSTIWSTPVAYEGFLYGSFTPYNSSGPFMCIDMQTGAEKWSAYGFGRGGVLLVDNHILSLTERGELALIKPLTNAYTEVARMLAIPGYNSNTNKCWNSPAVCDGRLYVRSTAYAACFDLAIPDLRLSVQRPADAGFNLSIQTTDASPLDSNRVAGISAWSSTNLIQPYNQWDRLSNSLVLTNGSAVIKNIENRETPRFFIISEPR